MVVALLRWWPESVDRLEEEKGMVDGPKPAWLYKKDDDNFLSNFLFGEQGSATEFGAEQCSYLFFSNRDETLLRLGLCRHPGPE